MNSVGPDVVQTYNYTPHPRFSPPAFVWALHRVLNVTESVSLALRCALVAVCSGAVRSAGATMNRDGQGE